jgi:hypothetical protein
MRRLIILMIAVVAACTLLALSVDAATATKKQATMSRTTGTHKAMGTTHGKVIVHRRTVMRHPAVRRAAIRHRVAVVHHKRMAAVRRGAGPKWVCHRVYPHKRVARVSRVRAGAGPTCPAPIVNVPQQAAPVVNVPQQPAPVVNVAAPPPGVGITTDQCNIYVVQGDQLLVIDKNTMCVVKKTTLGSQ